MGDLRCQLDSNSDIHLTFAANFSNPTVYALDIHVCKVPSRSPNCLTAIDFSKMAIWVLWVVNLLYSFDRADCLSKSCDVGFEKRPPGGVFCSQTAVDWIGLLSHTSPACLSLPAQSTFLCFRDSMIQPSSSTYSWLLSMDRWLREWPLLIALFEECDCF